MPPAGWPRPGTFGGGFQTCPLLIEVQRIGCNWVPGLRKIQLCWKSQPFRRISGMGRFVPSHAAPTMMQSCSFLPPILLVAQVHDGSPARLSRCRSAARTRRAKLQDRSRRCVGALKNLAGRDSDDSSNICIKSFPALNNIVRQKNHMNAGVLPSFHTANLDLSPR